MEHRWRAALDLLFGIGFRIGFLVALVGLIMMYAPLIYNAINPLLDYIGFWNAFRANPSWLRVSATGLALMAAAVAVSVIKGWVEEMIEILFGKDEFIEEKPPQELR